MSTSVAWRSSLHLHRFKLVNGTPENQPETGNQSRALMTARMLIRRLVNLSVSVASRAEVVVAAEEERNAHPRKHQLRRARNPR